MSNEQESGAVPALQEGGGTNTDIMQDICAAIVSLNVMMQAIISAYQPKPGMDKVSDMLKDFEKHMSDELITEITSKLDKDSKDHKSFANALIAKYYVEPSQKASNDIDNEVDVEDEDPMTNLAQTMKKLAKN